MEADQGSYVYGYDAANRLTEVTKDGALVRAYGYDSFGNRSQKLDYTGEATIETTYRYNQNNQLIAELEGEIEKTYRYDHRGNLTEVSQGTELLKQFSFDATNRMSESMGVVDGILKRAGYEYNGLGQRVGQKIWNVGTANGLGTIQRYKLGQEQQRKVQQPIQPENPEQSLRYTLDLTKQYHNLLHLSEAQSGKNQTFYWDGNVTAMEEAGEESFYLQDDLGSPMELLDAEGEIREAYGYDEFGVSLMTQNTDRSVVYTADDIFYKSVQPFGFTGYQVDMAGGMYFAQARRYDARSGRFTSEDKVKGFTAMPVTLNAYGYCWNHPMDLVDLNGMWPTWSDVGNFISEHKEAIIATTVAVVGVAAIAAVTVATGGVAAPVLIGAAAGAGINVVDEVLSEVKEVGWENVDVDKVIVAGATGALSGALMGSGAGRFISTVGNGVISAAGSVATDMIDYEAGEDIASNDIIKNALWSGSKSMLSAFLGGPGVQYGGRRTVTMVTAIGFDGQKIRWVDSISKNIYYYAVGRTVKKKLIDGIIDNMKDVGKKWGCYIVQEIVGKIKEKVDEKCPLNE